MSEERIAKYDRVLPKLRLDRSVFTASTPIVVHVDQPLGELCDVVARLVNVENGRTYAQTEVMLSDETREIPLGKALNIPDGAYEVMLTPPLAEFHGNNPSARHLKCAIAAAPFSTAPCGDPATRREEAIGAVAARGGAMGALAVAVADERLPSMEAVDQLARDLDGAGWVLAAAIAANRFEPAFADLIQVVSGPAGGLVAEIVAALLSPGSSASVAPSLRRIGTHGFPQANVADETTIAALAALAALDDGPAGELAVAALDKAFLCLALRASSGCCERLGPTAALTRLAWGVGSFGSPGPATLALAAAGYEVPAVIQAIALDPDEATNVEVHAAGGAGERVATWRRDGASLGTGAALWQPRLSAEAELTWSGGSAVATRADAALAAGPMPGFPAWAFDAWRTVDGRLFASLGANYLALVSDAPVGVVPDDADAITGGDVWFCQLGHEARDGTFEVFIDKVRALDVDLAAPRAVSLAGDTLVLDEAASADLHLDTPYVRQPFGEDTIEIRYGDHGLVLDFG